MKIFHTSPKKISRIEKTELFDDVLFFSDSLYYMNTESRFVYSLEIEESELLDVSSVFYDDNSDKIDDIIADLAEYADVDFETAQDLLDETQSIVDYTNDCEDLWYIQKLQAQIAKKMGYKGAIAEDEQGTVYIIPCSDKFGDLKLESEE